MPAVERVAGVAHAVPLAAVDLAVSVAAAEHLETRVARTVCARRARIDLLTTGTAAGRIAALHAIDVAGGTGTRDRTGARPADHMAALTRRGIAALNVA